MNILKIRNLELGTGIPAICIPNNGRTKDEILSLTKKYINLPLDIMEWRADWFEDIEDPDAVLEILKEMREILKDIPLLFTFRTKKEGGVHEMSISKYVTLNETIAKTGLADLIDVEIFTGDTIVNNLISSIHTNNCKIIASNHDFQKTPEKNDIISRLCKMQDMGADILKIAVMPQNTKDILTLLSATEEMVRKYAKCPVVTMSMSGMGSISRICGEVFGSCLTFGSGETASAPGQIKAETLEEMLTILHDSL